MANMIEVSDRSIFDSDCQTIVNTVNCVGVMGKGVALEYRLRFPEMFEDYEQYCLTGHLRPGVLHLYTKSKPWILNFPTKNDWKHPSKLSYIEQGLKQLTETYSDDGITSIAFPRLGTTSGGLSWNRVQPTMWHFLEPLPNITVEVYEYRRGVSDQLFETFCRRTQDFSVDDFVAELGVNNATAYGIDQALREGQVSGMVDFQSIRGVGPRAITSIYDFATRPNHQPRLEFGHE